MKKLIALSDFVAMTALLGLLVIVVAGIFTRFTFDVTGGRLNLMSGGAIEAATYALLVLVFAGFSRTVSDGLIRVEFGGSSINRKALAFLDSFWSLLVSSFAAVMAWRFAGQVMTTWARGDTTQDLQLPLFVIYGYLTMACLMLTAAALFRVRSDFISHRARKESASPMRPDS